MDVLKYLDVLIGLSLVMVLVSPMVTAVTQVYMWLRNRRTMYLQQMLQRLLVQIDSPRGVIFEVTKGAGPAQVELITERRTVLGQTDGTGRAWVETGVPPDEVVAGTVKVTAHVAGSPAAGHALTARFVPHRSIAHTTATTGPSQAGKASVKHTYSDAPGLASRKAKLTVIDPAGAATPTKTVRWSLNGSATRTATPVNGVFDIDLPAVTASPFEYAFEFEPLDASNGPLEDVTIKVEFVRFDGADHRVVAGPGDTPGSFVVNVPRDMDAILAGRLARAVVKHPLLARGPAAVPNRFPKIPPFKNRDAEVVEREELIRVLLELAAAEGEGSERIDAADRTRLRTVLALHGIPNPAVTLSNVRSIAQQLEKTEPNTAANIRHTQAIVSGAQSDLVGKINHWFDTASARATQQYAAEARAVTIVAALAVALAIQLDTLGVLRRLSTDPVLRAALVEEARAEQERIDKLKASGGTSTSGTTQTGTANPNPQGGAGTADTAKGATGGAKPAAGASGTQSGSAAGAGGQSGTGAASGGSSSGTSTGATQQDDLALSTAKREEIERNLATLRGPDFSIVPDHFVWQRLRRGRIEQNPMWTGPYPANLFLVAGGATHTIPMRWRRDALADIKASIDASGAPVRTSIERNGPDVVIRSDEPLELHAISTRPDVDAPRIEVARAELDVDAIPLSEATPRPILNLIVDGTAHPLGIAWRKNDVVAGLGDAIFKTGAPVVVTCSTPRRKAIPCKMLGANVPAIDQPRFVEFTASTPGVRDIQLVRGGQPPANVLRQTSRATAYDLAAPLHGLARAVLDSNHGDAQWAKGFDFTAERPMHLMVDAKAHAVTFKAEPAEIFAKLAAAIRAAKAGVSVACVPVDPTKAEGCGPGARLLELTATDPTTREIRLLWNPQDPYSNVLNDTILVAQGWRLPRARLEDAKAGVVMMTAGRRPNYSAIGIPPAAAGQAVRYYTERIAERFAKHEQFKLRAIEASGDDLVITAKRLGPLELRHAAAQPGSNVLNSHQEHALPLVELLARHDGYGGASNDPAVLGVLLSWILLSLGAPFWYDALKNLLKLRPSAAAVEERHRTDRSKDTPPAASRTR
jgi:hypothetical protein